MIRIDGHTIRSRPLRSDEPIGAELAAQTGMPDEFVGMTPIFMAFSTRVDDRKTVMTAIGVGAVVDGEPRGTPLANAALKTMSAHMRPGGTLIILPCGNPKTARDLALNALFFAKDGDGLWILCRDSAICDAVLITKTFGVEFTRRRRSNSKDAAR